LLQQSTAPEAQRCPFELNPQIRIIAMAKQQCKQQYTILFEELLNEVMALFKETILLKSISFVSEITPGMTLWADKQMISTILRNLLSNAIKYSHPGGRIVISARQDPDEFILSVRDYGIGIAPDIRNKLFRLEKNISTPGTLNETGTGLGILLCKEFTERHHGRIWVESNTSDDSGETGTVFYISFPNPLPGRIQVQ
jgi:signal transduction histidine kinase